MKGTALTVAVLAKLAYSTPLTWHVSCTENVYVVAATNPVAVHVGVDEGNRVVNPEQPVGTFPAVHPDTHLTAQDLNDVPVP